MINSAKDIKGLIFTGKVTGTPPKSEDVFNVRIRLCDAHDNELQVLKYHPAQEVCRCNADGTPTQIVLQMPNMPENLGKIEVEEEGQDVEYWAGNYGTKFEDERLYLEVEGGEEDGERHLKKEFGVRSY